MYEVLLERQAERDLRELPKETFRRVIQSIKGLGQAPRPPGCRKLVGSQQDYRVRVGDYRVLYEVDDGTRQVRVLRVRHRREAYR